MRAVSVFSALWQEPILDVGERLRTCMHLSRERSLKDGSARVFFRADDVGVPSARFGRLLEVFSVRGVPLNVAVVPAWLTQKRWRALDRLGGASALWCWHQHGWRHWNHETRGRKGEFGPSRSASGLRRDLRAGRARLEAIMGPSFFPAFTPPWNRCDARTLHLLPQLGYRVVSRTRAAAPRPPGEICELSVDVDLHTRRESDPASGWDGLFGELERGLASGLCGIMIHHQRMNEAAFAFLDLMLHELKRRRDIRLLDFRDLAATHGPGPCIRR